MEMTLSCNDHQAIPEDWYKKEPSIQRRSLQSRHLLMRKSYAQYRAERRRRIYASRVFGRDAIIHGLDPAIGGYEGSALEQRFNELADEWRRQKGPISSITLKSMIPAYQRIIGLGRAIIPLILKELERKPDHWFYALEMLTTEDENPVSDSDAGNINKMAAAWVRWGKEKRLIR